MKIIAISILFFILQGCTSEKDNRTNAEKFKIAEYRCENFGGLYEVITKDGYALCANGIVVHLMETKKDN